jgi:phosphoglycerate dehydrogenase-like enzyme
MAGDGHALAMSVLAWSQDISAEACNDAGAALATKDELLSRSDAISLHLVLSPRSHHTIGAAEIALMKPGAILINSSRSESIDQDALVAALGAGRICAGLDVYDREPLAADDRMRRLPHTVVTPQLGYSVAETQSPFSTARQFGL